VKVPGVVARHRSAVVAGAVVVAIAGVTFVVIRAGTGGGADHSATPATATTTAPSGPAAELVSLVRRAESANLDVAYAGTEASAGTFRAHLWRRSPLARLDTESGQGDGARRSAQLVSAAGPVACTQAGSAPWSCAPKPGLALGDVGVVSPALVAKLSVLDVSVRDDRLLGQGVRCFTVAAPATTGTPTTGTPTTGTPTTGTPTTGTPTTGAAGPSDVTAELCLTSDGIPVRVVLGSTHLDAVSLVRGRPPDSVFKPPAG